MTSIFIVLLAIAVDVLWLGLVFAGREATSTAISLAVTPTLLSVVVVVLALRVPAREGLPRRSTQRTPSESKLIGPTMLRYGGMTAVFIVGAMGIWVYLAVLDRDLNAGHYLAMGFGAIATLAAVVTAFLAGRDGQLERRD